MKFKIIILIMLGALVVSCSDFLEENPQTSLTEEQTFAKLENIEPLLLGAYTNWRNLQKDRNGLAFQLGTDESKQGTFQVNNDPNQAGLDYYNGFLSEENTAVTALWNGRWPIVNTAAQAIFALSSNTEEDSDRRSRLLGQASFLRAALSFTLAQYWGEIPIIDKSLDLGYGRQPLPDVYDFIIKDLEVAAQTLPETQENKSFPTKGAAMALLGKVYMYAPEESNKRDYAMAASWFEQVINSGNYSLVPNFSTLWDPNQPNPVESIYAFQFGNTSPDNNVLQWQAGSRALANIDQYAYFGGYDLLLPTEYCYKEKSEGGIWEPGDQRRFESIRYDFTYQGAQPTLPAGFGGDELDPHIKKFEDIRTQGNLSFYYSGKNKFYLRYSDVLLCYAECLNEMGNTGEAISVVNQVRERAFGGSLPSEMAWNGFSQEEFRTQILNERMRELCFEGWRRMDLIRTGNFVDYISSRNPWANQAGQIDENNRRYPIPLTEILQNPDIGPEDQNPGY